MGLHEFAPMASQNFQQTTVATENKKARNAAATLEMLIVKYARCWKSRPPIVIWSF